MITRDDAIATLKRIRLEILNDVVDPVWVELKKTQRGKANFERNFKMLNDIEKKLAEQGVKL